ncbi:MAG: hypothetical protein ABL888_22545 [Pirellulaceae bacterium]
MNFFRVSGPLLWGGYGMLLAGGFARCGGSEEEPFLLFRTGPFIPPISFPFPHVVVTQDFRKQIDDSGWFSFDYRNVVKKHIAKLHWERWDRNADQPKKYPRGGEPEGYILNSWHSRSAAKQMGDIWELRLPRGADTASKEVEGERRMKVMVNPESWDGQNFFRSKTQGYLIVSTEGAEWLRQTCQEWVTLDACIDWDSETAVA